MIKMSNAIRKEVIRMLIALAPMCLIMYGIFAIAGYWQLPTILGTLAGYSLASLYYFMLACALEQSLAKETEAEARLHQFKSYWLRLGVIGVVVAAAIYVPQVNVWATIIPLVFPRIAIYILQAWDNIKERKNRDSNEDQESVDER
ncbi:MAG: ATP synthase subunit I [Clostridia bacterium]|nr:ATP synthase subunit I [Clostridia bacterium]